MTDGRGTCRLRDRVVARKRGGNSVARHPFTAGCASFRVKTLPDHVCLHGECLTLTGRTIAENPEYLSGCDEQDVVLPAQRPITPNGVVGGLESNLTTDGQLVEVAGMENLTFTGPASCFGSKEDCFEAVDQRRLEQGIVFGFRYAEPGGGRLRPAATARASIAHRRDGDIIDIEAVEDMLDLEFCDAEPPLRRAARAHRRAGSGAGAIWNDAEGVGPARTGAVLRPGARGEISSYADI
ncbi:MAG: dihydroxy-acid dehydratase [Ancalomicrobiaceae bacterium]|nr:dihydroxy-acid dehydratase [Ancalomicrobiaceae bacterium]